MKTAFSAFVGTFALAGSMLPWLCAASPTNAANGLRQHHKRDDGDPFLHQLCLDRAGQLQSDVTKRAVACQRINDHGYDTRNVKFEGQDKYIENGDPVYACGFLLTGDESYWWTWTPDPIDFCAILKNSGCTINEAKNDVYCHPMDDTEMHDWQGDFNAQNPPFYKYWYDGAWH